jgi:succinyl-CoA synthetase beta subunit
MSYEMTDLLVKDILAGNVRSDVTTDGVSDSIRSVGVKLSSRISLGLRVSWVNVTGGRTYDVHGCTVPETVDLDVVRSLDEVGGGYGSIGDESGSQYSLEGVHWAEQWRSKTIMW